MGILTFLDFVSVWLLLLAALSVAGNTVTLGKMTSCYALPRTFFPFPLEALSQAGGRAHLLSMGLIVFIFVILP